MGQEKVNIVNTSSMAAATSVLVLFLKDRNFSRACMPKRATTPMATIKNIPAIML